MMLRTCLMLTLFTVTGVCQIQRDQKAPDFTLPDLEGNNYQLSKNLGKGPVLINFWATWCAPCLDEMKALKPIYEKYKDRDLTILSISVDDPKTAGRVGSFVNSRKYPFKILMDTNNEIMQLYQTQVPPFSVLLDQDGKVVYTHTGYRKGDEAELDSRIEALLATR